MTTNPRYTVLTEGFLEKLAEPFIAESRKADNAERLNKTRAAMAGWREAQ